MGKKKGRGPHQLFLVFEDGVYSLGREEPVQTGLKSERVHEQGGGRRISDLPQELCGEPWFGRFS